MGNTAQNMIHNASFNFEYGTAASAARCNILIETIFKSHILSELEKAISNHIPEGLTIELSKLEINIGRINEKDLVNNLAGRIRTSLEDALKNKTSIGKSALSGETALVAQKSGIFLLESIDIYFQRGYFLFGMDQSVSIDELVTNAIDNYKKEFIEILKNYHRYDDILKRIAYSLSAEAFDLTLLTLEPVYGKWITDFRQILIRTRKDANLNQLSGDEFVRTINYSSLNYLLNNTGSDFNKAKFSEYILSQLIRIFNTDIQIFVEAFKKRHDPVLNLINESLSKLAEKQTPMLPEVVDLNLKIDHLLEILNSGSIQDKTIKPELLKSAIVQAIRNTERRKLFIEKLNKSGIRMILELLSNKDADALFELISAFSNTVNQSNIKSVHLNEVVLNTADYLNLQTIRSFSPEELVVFLIYSAGLDDVKIINSTSFLNFIQTQKNIDLKKFHDLINDEALYPEISDIQKSLFNNRDTNSSKNEIQPIVSNAEEYFIISKRKIIGNYLHSGQLSDAYYDLSLSDVQTILWELILLKDDFLTKQFHRSEHPDNLIKRLNMLTDNMPTEELEAYFYHYFKREFDILSGLMDSNRHHFSSGNNSLNNSRFRIEVFISSLIKSKGGSLPEVFLLSAIEGLYNESTQDSDIPEIGSLLKNESYGSELEKMLEKDFKQLHLYEFGIKSSEEEVKKLVKSISFYFQVDQTFFLDYLQKNPTVLPQVYALFKSRFDQNLWNSMEKAILSRPELKHELDKFQKESDVVLRKVMEKEFDLDRIFKSLAHLEPENLKAFMILSMNDVALFEKLISNTKDIQFPSDFNFGNKTTINYLNQLLSHPPEVKSAKIDGNFWKSLVLSFGFQIFSEGNKTTSISFAGSFLNHLLLKLKAINEEEKFYPILEQMKLSKSKELVELAGFWQNTKILIANTFGSENENPSKETDHYLSILRSFALNGSFPWWANNISFSELMSGLSNSSRLYPVIFEKSLLRVEKEESILELLIPKIPKSIMTEFNQLFTGHTELKSIWKNILQKNKKDTQLKSGTNEGFDEKSMLLKEIYNSDDEKGFNKWLNGYPEISGQITEYLSLSPYFFFRNMNPAQWRKAIYQFSLDYYGQTPTKLNHHFPDDFLKYLKQNHSNINWSENLATVYQLIHSPNAKINAVFPEALIPLINIEAKNIAMTDNENIFISENDGEEVKVYNSGLILFWPFLTRLFEILLLVENGDFVDTESKNRAVYILQYLVYNDINFPEHQLVLNKLLAGLQPEEHLVPLTSLTDEEMDSAQSLLNGLINNWDKMKNTSPEGLQETFLQREGILKFQTDKITLTVEQKGYDILLQSIPWNISLVKLSWMKIPIYVEWI